MMNNMDKETYSKPLNNKVSNQYYEREEQKPYSFCENVRIALQKYSESLSNYLECIKLYEKEEVEELRMKEANKANELNTEDQSRCAESDRSLKKEEFKLKKMVKQKPVRTYTLAEQDSLQIIKKYSQLYESSYEERKKQFPIMEEELQLMYEKQMKKKQRDCWSEFVRWICCYGGNYLAVFQPKKLISNHPNIIVQIDRSQNEELSQQMSKKTKTIKLQEEVEEVVSVSSLPSQDKTSQKPLSSSQSSSSNEEPQPQPQIEKYTLMRNGEISKVQKIDDLGNENEERKNNEVMNRIVRGKKDVIEMEKNDKTADEQVVEKEEDHNVQREAFTDPLRIQKYQLSRNGEIKGFQEIDQDKIETTIMLKGQREYKNSQSAQMQEEDSKRRIVKGGKQNRQFNEEKVGQKIITGNQSQRRIENRRYGDKQASMSVSYDNRRKIKREKEVKESLQILPIVTKINNKESNDEKNLNPIRNYERMSQDREGKYLDNGGDLVFYDEEEEKKNKKMVDLEKIRTNHHTSTDNNRKRARRKNRTARFQEENSGDVYEIQKL